MNERLDEFNRLAETWELQQWSLGVEALEEIEDIHNTWALGVFEGTLTMILTMI